MTKLKDNWNCNECGQPQGRHDMWFDGACGECVTDKQKEIKRMIIENFMLWHTGEFTEEMRDSIYEYVENDHVNELTK
jgi:hypothetical protein